MIGSRVRPSPAVVRRFAAPRRIDIARSRTAAVARVVCLCVSVSLWFFPSCSSFFSRVSCSFVSWSSWSSCFR